MESKNKQTKLNQTETDLLIYRTNIVSRGEGHGGKSEKTESFKEVELFIYKRNKSY